MPNKSGGRIVFLKSDFFNSPRVHFMRNALAHVPKGQTTMVAAAIRQIFLQPSHAAAVQSWRHVADQLRARWPKLGNCMDDAEADVLAYMAFPTQHRSKLHSTDEIDKRFCAGRGIFPRAGDLVAKRGASAGSAARRLTRALPD